MATHVSCQEKQYTYQIHPCLQYQYLCFRRTHKKSNQDTPSWFHTIPYYKKEFEMIHNAMEGFIRAVHTVYLKHYVYKSLDKSDIFEKYYKHVYKIHHDIYLPSLKGQRKTVVSLDVVRKFFDEKEPREMLFILRN